MGSTVHVNLWSTCTTYHKSCILLPDTNGLEVTCSKRKTVGVLGLSLPCPHNLHHHLWLGMVITLCVKSGHLVVACWIFCVSDFATSLCGGPSVPPHACQWVYLSKFTHKRTHTIYPLSAHFLHNDQHNGNQQVESNATLPTPALCS
jgi:hypothetical protein